MIEFIYICTKYTAIESENLDFTMWHESAILIFRINLRSVRDTYRITEISYMNQSYLRIIKLVCTGVQQNYNR
jgi:hypothetical protein